MEDLLYRIDSYETKGYWLREFENIKEEYGLDVGITQVGDNHYVEVDKLFSLIEDLVYEIEKKQEEIEDLKSYYEGE